MSRKLNRWTAVCLTLICCFGNFLRVHAEPTAVDLYKFYDKTFSVVYPDEVLDTINKYINAQKYGRMFRYVSISFY